METIRDLVKDTIREYLEHPVGEPFDRAYEYACDLADLIFLGLGVSPEEQDRLIERNTSCRLPIVTIKGKRYFVDERLKELRNVTNPHERVDL